LEVETAMRWLDVGDLVRRRGSRAGLAKTRCERFFYGCPEILGKMAVLMDVPEFGPEFGEKLR